MKRFIFLFLLLSLAFSLSGCIGTSYYSKSGWNSKMELSYFETVYYEHYKEKIEELKELYGIEVETLEERYGEDSNLLYIYLYNTLYTIKILVSPEGYYKIGLYYYDDYYFGKTEKVADYEEIKNVVNFINVFTNYEAFDTVREENCFERLYKESCASEKGSASFHYHYDSDVGNVGYTVETYSTWGNYYYMMRKNSDTEIRCTALGFNGVLKPLGSDGIYCE